MLFVSVWTFLVIFFLALAPRFMDSSLVRMAVVGVDLLTALFWFAAFIALAVLYNKGIYYDGFNFHSLCLVVKNGCSVMEADVVFGAFEWYVHRLGEWGMTRDHLSCLSLSTLFMSTSPLHKDHLTISNS